MYEIEVNDIIIIKNYAYKDIIKGEKQYINHTGIVTAIDSKRISGKWIDNGDNKINGSEFFNLPVKVIGSHIFLFKKGENNPHVKIKEVVVEKVVEKEVIKEVEYYVADFNKTPFDKLYNWYCKLLGRNRTERIKKS